MFKMKKIQMRLLAILLTISLIIPGTAIGVFPDDVPAVTGSVIVEQEESGGSGEIESAGQEESGGSEEQESTGQQESS